FYLICHQMAGKNPPVKQADFRSFYTCLTASRCKGFERILIKGLAPIFDIIRSNSLYVLDFLFVQQSLIKIRREFEQVINVRPAKILKGIPSPLAHPNNFDIIVVRENSEGEYSSVGGRMYQGDDEIAIQNSFFSRKATERAMKYAFEL